ncbi:MAG: hypothetical protein ACI8QS_000295 [Planctomycetota bacterium]|jgi:hypothetical protein
MKSSSFAFIAAAGALVLSLGLNGGAQEGPQVGYDDTPVLPGQEWRVHDIARPRPPVIQPGVGSAAPSDAIVLFDGKDMDSWSQGGDGKVQWEVQGDGSVMVTGGGSIRSREEFGDMQLHLEWASPSEVKGESQGRGNSGVIIMGRYEVQVLDSFENASYADGQAAAMYGQYPPDVNACRAPGEWQTYDIIFTAPRFEGDELLSPAIVTVLHNGVVVHNARPYIGAVAHRNVGTYSPHPPLGAIELQDHGNPVKFRNIWVRRL